jgi:MFS family permease
MYSLALLVFVIGSTFCGLAWNMPIMVAARVLAGIGSWLMQPPGYGLLYQNFPSVKDRHGLGFWGIAIAAAPAVGPTWAVICRLMPAGADLFIQRTAGCC